ncbi:K02A2.6-like [Cordylochernes scorpioides]|uniref:RNA-directed DNA polymerase n=1 Tax=Cordylochernes scorpioides TaxID=51811 RepID=A0ABY6LZ93_9ARAC|nr:K02A2.6-like [Cordylochernes scorpioides]
MFNRNHHSQNNGNGAFNFQYFNGDGGYRAVNVCSTFRCSTHHLYRQNECSATTAFAKAAAERQRRFKLRKSANIALTSGTSESPASTSCSVVERTSVPVVAERTSVPLTNAQRQRAFRQRRAASSRTDVQPTTSSSQTAIQLEQSTWYTKWSSSIRRFQSTFLDNDFGHACSICDRLWFKNDLKTITALQLKVISDWYVKENRQLRKEDYTKSCNTCRQSLNKRKLPTLAKVNGFSYPDIPPGLPPLDPIRNKDALRGIYGSSEVGRQNVGRGGGWTPYGAAHALRKRQLYKELKGKRFDSDEDVQKVVQDFFHTLPKSAYKEDIYKLPERWRRCIESQEHVREDLRMFSHVTQRSVALPARIQPPEIFDFSTPNEWPKWRKRFERYLVVSGMKKKEEADKIDLFMYLMGDRADDIFRTFKFEKEEEATKLDSVLKAFDSHFCVRKNIIYERAKFNSRIQEDREPVDEFITSLYKLADSCEFEGLHEQLIRDRIVVGVRDKALSERMQLDSELTLEKAVKMVRQQEAVRQQQVDLQRPSTSQKVSQVNFNSKKQSPKQQQQPSRKKEKSAKTRSRCPKCGGFTHREGQACRAEGQRCNLCSKTGHFANCCPDKQAKTAEVKAVSELDEEIGFLLEVSAVEDSSNLDNDEDECRRRWTAEIQVNGKKVKFKLDSQADVTCVPLCLFKKIMGQQRLVKSDINIRAAEFSELQTVGMFISTLRNGNYEIKEKIYVIRRLSEPLLSRRACELLNLARRIEVVATRINPIKEFPEVFEGLGQIGNPYEIKLKPGAKPYAVHTPRRVPIPLMERLKTRLEELEKAGIIAQVNVATEWCAPTVIAGKPNGDIRLCVDLSRLNEHVQREVHPMPVVEHMLGQLGEARFFSKLDANSGFHQIPLSPDCQHLTTFITPFGRYKYCRMPFGISLAPEYFQRVMSIILQGMDGVMCYLDDILIFASDSKTHDRILRLVLRKLKEAKVTLNKAKCVFGVPRINFLGHILDEDGIRPDPAKIEAVAKMPAPTDVHGVRRFLGMVNHLGRFVENLSEIVAPLNQLLVKGQDFVWDCSQERAFRKLKELLTTQPILAAYDVRKPTMVSSDASSYGLGAVLKQEGKNGIWRPVAYSSRTMTPTEKRYAQIEKEALAITWACERFQDFLLGKRFRIETDHKPLIPLFSTKELSSLTPRLQRFRMRMMRFGFEIVHIPGKELLDADALSRQPLLTTEGGEDERPTSAHINAVLSSITDKDEMLTKIFEAQQEDTTLKAVVNYLEQGWPDKKKMSQALLSYWHVKDELGVQNGLLMRSCRLVIPASMKLEILDKLHAGHFGITKTRLRARETVWWPGISEEIAETVRKCSVCIQEAVSKHEPLIPTNFPTRPWQKIGMDLFKFENKWYLVVIDYYSRYPEMVQLDRLTASVVVRSCKSIFARHGIPETVVSDNGTQFGAAREFANFARQYGFTHVTSSPRFPQSNGMAEAGVKIAKLILKKNQDPSLGLLEYRSTPLENGYSPAELLMGRKLRTTLPIAPENLNPKLVDSQTLKRKEGRRRKDMKSRFDRRCGATDMEELSEGDTVWITDMRTWGIVKQKASTPRSYMVDTPVGTLRRNRFHLRKGVTVQYPADPSTPTFSGEELVENEKTPVVDYPSNDSEDAQIRTRSGRIVKPVDRLHY